MLIENVGFTGTKAGMTLDQHVAVGAALAAIAGDWTLHHGDCIGADAEAHRIALVLRHRIVVHPPIDPKARAFTEGASEYRDPLPYLDRNRAIVDAVQLLIAAPKTDAEQLRSGTWATVRYARERGVLVAVVGPAGLMEGE